MHAAQLDLATFPNSQLIPRAQGKSNLVLATEYVRFCGAIGSSTTSWRFVCVAFSLLFSVAHGEGQLSTTFYGSTCSNLETIVRSAVNQTIVGDRRMGASLLRLFFHDCFVQGCDGSILLDDVAGSFVGEKTAFPNVNSIRGYEVIDQIKTSVENSCPGVVSCADILALAARDGTFLLGGPSWKVPLGRRDSTAASLAEANRDLPAASSGLDALLKAFRNKKLGARDMTALSGGHSIGFSQCQNFRAHIYNDSNVDPVFTAQLKTDCSSASGPTDGNLAPFDMETPLVFDNAYYGNLLARRGLLHSDQELYNNGTQDALAQQYSSNNKLFFDDFIAAMVKMGNINPLTGTDGQIRLNCRAINR